MTGKRLQFVILVAALLSALMLRAADLSPWDEWRLGYTNFEIGEQNRSRGNYTAALEAFEKSRIHYQAVKRSRPDWNQKVIRERLSACDKQISELRRLLGNKAPIQQEPAPSQNAEVSTPVERPKTQPREEPDYAAQLRRLRAELEEAKAELEELRNERAKRGNYETEIANLLRDRRIAGEKYALLEKRCQQLQEELKKPESALQELRRQLVEKNERLADAEKSIRLLEERLRRGERSAVENNREKNMLRSQLRQAGEERQRLQQEVGALSSSIETERLRLERAKKRIAELEQALRDAEKNFSTKIADGAAVSQEEIARLRNIASAAEKRADQFQKQCVELRGECDELMKKLESLERLRVKSETDMTALRGEADKQRTRAESLADELANVRELQRRQEEELKRVLAELEPLRARLARRDSEDFKGMVEAREATRKLEAEIAALRTREAELSVALSEEKKTAESLRRELEILRGDVRKAKGAQKSAEQELEKLRSDAEKYRELQEKYQTLESNFAALQRENQENRAKVAAASPREAELQRIKLRLVELNQLKSSLGKEQRLNSELMAEKKRMEEELKILREKSSQLSAARKQLEAMKALELELAELRRVNQDAVTRLEKMKNLEGELVAAKRALIESGAAQLELHEVKQAYDKVVAERNAAASEAARLRDMLAELRERSKRSDSKLRADKSDTEQALEKTRQQLEEAKRSDSKLRADKIGTEQALEKTRQQLEAAKEKLAQMEALAAQLEKLRKLNDELMYARSFEAELVKARAELGELARYKEELAGMVRLNEQLVNEKNELEKELTRRISGSPPEELDERNRIILAASNEKPEDYVAEGITAESTGNVELAVWNYRKALELERNHPVAAERLGMILLRREEFSEAAQALAIARNSAPGRLDLALALSRAYLGQKRFGNAQAVVEPLLRDNPENGELLVIAALAAADGGDPAKAEKYLKLAIRYMPKSPEPLMELSRVLVRHDSARMDEAAKLYESARIMGAAPDIELEPALGPRLDKRRELELFLTSAMNEAFDGRDYYGAAWYCKQLLEINRRPRYFTPLLALARLLGGESGSARETLTFNDESAQGALVLALIELKDGDKQAFSAAIRRALALNKGKPVVIDIQWRNLGLALDAAGVADRAAGKELARAYKWE